MTDTINHSTADARSTTGGRGPRRVAGLAATAALGFALLAGVGFRQTRQEARPAAPPAAVNPYWVYTEDVAIDGNPAAVADPFVADPRVVRPADASITTDYRWALPPGIPAFVADPRVARPADASITTDYRWALPPGIPAFVADQFTYREDHRSPAPDNQDCMYASSTGVPGEGCNR